MKIFYCYGKNDFCDRDACFACEYYDGSDREEIELTPEQEKAWQQLKKEEAAAAAWEEFKKTIKDTLNKFFINFLYPVCEMLLGFAGLCGAALIVLSLILTVPLWAIPYIIFKLKNKEGRK